ncbi:hypothetical protein K3G63_20785 [Hymenobacter sp. HSC-4F20]|uniref:hypothetical protein n=1 Tax=Hymenobacter sp. HSC-4F20 TaxID=2864135 RepID=UPI001C72EBCE|nr:hypothetical protein [Hymenobacter sp. HSC-4F20]MBX0292891.1 hypothetical protein [Hymenobacter sp. HSC-4F20]
MTDKAYPYFSDSNVVRIRILKEYFFPTFVLTVDELIRSPIYQTTHTILLDFTECYSVHGIGMSLETQLFYEQAKAQGKSVYWVGQLAMYNIVASLNEGSNTGSETLPYKEF